MNRTATQTSATQHVENAAAMATDAHHVPHAALKRFLSDLDGYVVLRNHDVIASLERGSDIDLLVRDLRAAERTARVHLGPPLWTTTRPHLKQYLYAWGNIDLLPECVQWKGAPYLHAEAALACAERSALGFPKPRLAHEALVSWMNSLLWGGFFKERYRPVILRAAREDGAAFLRALTDAFGQQWAERLFSCAQIGTPEQSAQWAGALRRALWWRAFRRRPARTVQGGLRRLAAEARLRLRPPMPWLAVLGPDGSGKSSVLNALEERLAGYKVVRGHWRPGVLLPWEESQAVNPNPHGEAPRSALTSAGKVFFLVADWWLGYWRRIADRRSRSNFVFFDRHYLDLLVDPRRYRFGEPMWLARWAARFVPQPDLLVVLDAPPEVLQQRKQEVPLEETRRQRAAYRALAERLPNAHIVNARRPLSVVVDDVEQLLLTCRSERASTRAREHGAL